MSKNLLDMKKYCIVASALSLLLMCASCSKKDSVTLIPADATFVAQVNLSDLADEADLKNNPLVSIAKGYIGLVVSGDEKKLLSDILDNPSVMGVDFTTPAYVFETTDHCWGLVLKVDDAGDLEDFFTAMSKQQIASKPTERDKLMWTTLLGDINLAYDDDRLLIFTAQQDDATPASLKRQMTALFSQDNDHSFRSSNHMDKLDGADAPIAIYSRMAALPQDMMTTFAEWLPEGVRAADVEVCMSLAFRDGGAVLRASMFSDNDRTQVLFDENNAHLHKIQGEFIDAASDRFFAWVSMGCEGAWLLKMLKQNEQAKQLLFMLERGIDIEQMLRSIDGDLTLVLPTEVSSDVSQTPFIALARIQNSDFLNDVSDWTRTARDYGITLSQTGQHQYVMKSQDLQLRWGVEERILYFATDQAALQKAFTPSSSPLSAYEDEIRNAQFFAFLNLQAVPDMQRTPFEAAVLKSDQMGEWELRVIGKDKHKSLLAQAIDMLGGLIKLP